MSWQTPPRPAPRRTANSGASAFALPCLRAGPPLGLLLLLLAGCATDRRLGTWDSPQYLSQARVEAWNYRGEPARRIKTDHYLIYTTIDDAEILASLPQIMEGALTQYRKLGPTPSAGGDAGAPKAAAPLECYIFERRVEWERFTREKTGSEAAVYLQIRRGGYAIGDKFFIFYIGREPTAAVAVHEGWHQYVARHFVGRLPPFVEEGFACLFEGVDYDSLGRPRWNLSINLVRVQALRRAVEGKNLWPLERLVSMHAGEVVEESTEKVEAFYGQAWCFAKFLYESENGRFRPALQRWIADTAAGTVNDPTGTHNHANGPWNRNGVKPMLEHYLGLDFVTIDSLYQAYVRKVAIDEYDAQWRSRP